MSKEELDFVCYDFVRQLQGVNNNQIYKQENDETSVTYEMTDSDMDSMMEDDAEEDDNFELWRVDRQEQQRAVEFYENKKRDSALNRSTRASSSTASAAVAGRRFNGRSNYNSRSRRNISVLPIPETLELYEGCSLPYKGPKETWETINAGLFNITQCIVCAQDLCCVANASHVICSSCKTISPVTQADDSSSHGGVIGFGVLTSDVQDHFQNSK